MVQGRPPYDDSKLTVRYAGEKLDAREIDGKIWFAVDGHAVLTREQQGTWDVRAFKPAPGTTANVTASVHVVIGGSSPAADDRSDPAAEGEVSSAVAAAAAAAAAASREEQSALLLKAAQASPAFAAATALPPGIHIMCYLPPSRFQRDATGAADGKPEVSDTSVIGQWAALWHDVRAGTRPAEEAELLMWQTPCQRLLHDAAAYVESESTRSLADSIRDVGTPTKGWALVPCAPSKNLVCELARGGWAGDDGGGVVAWLHHAMDSTEASASAVALADSLLLTSDAVPQPAYASISALNLGTGFVGVVAGAQRIIPRGVLKGYDLSLAPHDRRLEPGRPKDETTGNEEPRADRTLFVDDSAAQADVGQRWRGTVKTEELPGGGLHRHVRVTVDASCAGKACDRLLAERGAKTDSDSEWCEVLFAQHIPKGAYIDVDEVKTRHDFDVLPSLPANRIVGVETYRGKPIDVELPSSVSGQHVVNFSLWVDMSKRGRGLADTTTIRAEVTLPVHLRYPDPACKRREEDCEGYAWVEVPPPLVNIRCRSSGDTGNYSPVLPSRPPVGVALRVPRGMIWHRDFVMWGTVAAAALGCLYTIRTLFVISMGTAYGSDRKRR
ncbi:unnamed protein product [Pylaiella littoralis]